MTDAPADQGLAILGLGNGLERRQAQAPVPVLQSARFPCRSLTSEAASVASLAQFDEVVRMMEALVSALVVRMTRLVTTDVTVGEVVVVQLGRVVQATELSAVVRKGQVVQAKDFLAVVRNGQVVGYCPVPTPTPMPMPTRWILEQAPASDVDTGPAPAMFPALEESRIRLADHW